VIVTSLHAARSTIHHTLGISPGGLVFHQDMLLDIALLTNFQLMRDRQQVAINENLRQASLSLVIMIINLVKNALLFIMILPSSSLVSLDYSLLNTFISMALLPFVMTSILPNV
jgi:hypothetical protein